MSKHFNRRTFLTALGLGTGAALLPSLGGRGGTLAGPSRAAAQEMAPKRLVIFTTEHGTLRDNWKMQGPGLPADQDAEFSLSAMSEGEFSPILQPLYAHRDKLLVVEGLAQTSTLADVRDNNHATSRAHLLTGAPYRKDGSFGASDRSIDQIIAASIRRNDRFSSLEYGTTGGMFVMGEGGSKLPTERSPGRAFDRLFPEGSMVPEPSAPSADQLVGAQHGSVLDLASGEYMRISSRLSAEDRRRLEQHRDLIRDVETRLSSPSSIRCEAPTLTEAETFEQFARLTTAALACDLSRVASIQMAQMGADEFGAPSSSNVHQDYAHGGRSDADQWMTEYNRKHARQFSQLLSMLDAVPEGDGTLLDNTCVLWVTEMGTGAHAQHDIPVVMAGACGGAFRMGRYRRYAQTRSNPGRNGSPDDIGAPHSQLLISIAQGMDVDLNSLPTTEVTGLNGTRYDLTGPLAGLAG